MSAWMILAPRRSRPDKVAGARRSMSMALWFAAIFVPVQIVIGDLHGLGVLKVPADQARRDRGQLGRMGNMPLRLFALPTR
jgi:cytochrome d ubiquinol oxidase subunit I